LHHIDLVYVPGKRDKVVAAIESKLKKAKRAQNTMEAVKPTWRLLEHYELKRAGDEYLAIINNGNGDTYAWYPIRRSWEGIAWLAGDVPVRRKL
jgi:hypothetical protein